MYGHVMLIDGNDERGIDVAIMTRAGFDIVSICSNVDRTDSVGTVFSRDCPQFEIRTPGGALVHVLVNHFKSQSGGGGAKRLRQAAAVRAIADDLTHRANTSWSWEISTRARRPWERRRRTCCRCSTTPVRSRIAIRCQVSMWATSRARSTPAVCAIGWTTSSCPTSLQPSFTGGAVFRKGVWGDRVTRPTAWETYPEITQAVEQASDHSLVFVDLNV